MSPNGCGAEGSGLNPPDLHFKDACDDHDINYGVGGKEKDRAAADALFLRSMLKKARATPRLNRLYLVPAAYAYYAAVRVGGWRHFRYR